MPNVIKYTTGATETGCLRKGNMLIGNNTADYGLTFYNGINPPDGGYTIYLNKATGGPSIYTANNNAELISITNQIAGTNYITSAQCLEYYAGQTDKIVLNANLSPIVTDGLILCLHASDVSSYPKTSNIWYDLSGYGNNFTPMVNMSFTGRSFDFNGTDSGVQDHISSYNPDSADSVMELWFKPMDLSQEQAIFSDNYGPEYGFWIHSNGTLRAIAYASVYANLTVGKWYHAIMNIDPGATKNSTDQTYVQLYLNGEYIGQSNANTGNGMNDQPFTLGYDYRSGSPTRYFSGSIAAASVYYGQFNQSEVSQNYYGGPIITDDLVLALDAGNLVSFEDGSTAWYDMVNSNYSASLVGNVSYSTTYNGTLNADGSQTSDYIILPHQVLDNDISSNGAWSLECWLRMDNTSGTTYFFSTATPSTTNGWIIQKNSNTIFPWNESLQNGSAISFTAEETFHLTLTINGSSIYLYKNGSYIGRYSYTKNITNATGWVLNQEQDALLGGFQSSQATDMGINIIRVYNKTLSSEEVLQNFNAQRNRFGI